MLIRLQFAAQLNWFKVPRWLVFIFSPARLKWSLTGDQAATGAANGWSSGSVLMAAENTDCVFGSAGPHILLTEWTQVGDGLCLYNQLLEEENLWKSKMGIPTLGAPTPRPLFTHCLSEKHQQRKIISPLEEKRIVYLVQQRRFGFRSGGGGEGKMCANMKFLLGSLVSELRHWVWQNARIP